MLFPLLSVVFILGLQSCEDWSIIFYLECWVIPISINIISGSDLLKAHKQVRASCLALPDLEHGWDWAKHVSAEAMHVFSWHQSRLFNTIETLLVNLVTACMYIGDLKMIIGKVKYTPLENGLTIECVLLPTHRSICRGQKPYFQFLDNHWKTTKRHRSIF